MLEDSNKPEEGFVIIWTCQAMTNWCKRLLHNAHISNNSRSHFFLPQKLVLPWLYQPYQPYQCLQPWYTSCATKHADVFCILAHYMKGLSSWIVHIRKTVSATIEPRAVSSSNNEMHVTWPLAALIYASLNPTPQTNLNVDCFHIMLEMLEKVYKQV